MRDTLRNLRGRPNDEKTAIAASVSLGVVAILLIGWFVYFFHTLATTPAPNIRNAATNAAVSSGLQQAQQQLQQAYGSTTQFIESASGTIQLEQIGSTTPSL